MKSIAIFCGASSGHDPLYTQAATQLAELFVKQNVTLIYGGSTVGLMGTMANCMLEEQGKVIGVIPQSLVDVELAHPNLSKLHIVGSLNERKELISELADAFIMLPGGGGSLDEFFEMFTQAYLGYHHKPCAIFNCNNYYDKLLEFLDHAVKEGFLKAEYRNMIVVDTEPAELLAKLKRYESGIKPRWTK